MSRSTNHREFVRIIKALVGRLVIRESKMPIKIVISEKTTLKNNSFLEEVAISFAEDTGITRSAVTKIIPSSLMLRIVARARII